VDRDKVGDPVVLSLEDVHRVAEQLDIPDNLRRADPDAHVLVLGECCVPALRGCRGVLIGLAWDVDLVLRHDCLGKAIGSHLGFS